MADSLPDEPGYEEYLPTPSTTFQFRHVVEDDIEKIMKSQQPKLSCGVDTINNKLVKKCCTELTKPMTIIINLSIKLGIVPQLHKEARIVPLYKKDAPNLCGNYRPISSLASLSKILEKACLLYTSPSPRD